MAYQRISRSRKRELDEPDEFITLTGRLVNYAARNKQKIIAISVIALSLIVLLAGLRFYMVQTEKNAFGELDKALARYASAREKKDPKQVYLEVKPDFEKIVDQYASKKAAKIAAVVLADISYAAGEIDPAIALYEKSLKEFKNNPFYLDLIVNSLAYAWETKKEYEKAIEYLEKIRSGENSELKEEALFNLGRLYAETGHPEKEVEYFKQIEKDYPDSIYLDMVKEKLALAK
jgi:tetratricopeptide (TPR) repeat protein